MRNWVWGGFALAVFAGAGVYLAADHSVRHPDSFVGRCAISALKLGSQVGPIVLNRATSAVPWRGLSQRQTTLPDKPVCRYYDVPVACMPPADGFEPIVVEVEPVSQNEYVEPVIFSTASRTVAATPTLMPYAADEGDEPCEGTCVLEWLGCDQSCCQLFSNCMKALRVVTGIEQSVQVEVIDETDDETVEQPQAPEQPETIPLTPEQSSGIEEIPYGRMQEDPYHHHHYPCCPYTGRCPQPYPTAYPIIPRAEESNIRQNKPVINAAATPATPSKVTAGAETMDAKPSDIKESEDDSY